MVTTPLAIIVDVEDVMHVRAEDATGAFGILSGHADFLTALAISVVSWRNAQEAEHHVAVPGGDLHQLETEVLARFRRQLVEEQAACKDAQRLYLAAIRQICHYLRPGRSVARPGAHIVGEVEDLEQR